MKFNKKGAMEMSINLIIIIIIALAVLGMVLMFVRSKFAEAETQFNFEEPLAEADYSRPITFSGGDLVLKPGRPTGKRLSIYNSAAQPVNLATTPLNFSCSPATAITVSEPQNYEIGPGQTDTTQVTLSSAKPGTYLCKAMIFAEAAQTTRLLSSDVKVVVK